MFDFKQINPTVFGKVTAAAIMELTDGEALQAIETACAKRRQQLAAVKDKGESALLQAVAAPLPVLDRANATAGSPGFVSQAGKCDPAPGYVDTARGMHKVLLREQVKAEAMAKAQATQAEAVMPSQDEPVVPAEPETPAPPVTTS